MPSQRTRNSNNATVDASTSDQDPAVLNSTNAQTRQSPSHRSSFFNGTSSPVIDNGHFIGHQEIHVFLSNPSPFNTAGSSSEERQPLANETQETNFNLTVQRRNPSRPSRIRNALARIIRRRASQSQILHRNNSPVERDVFEIYKQHLLPKGYGHPLWIPQSNMRLPIPYRQTGVSIGDVGIITREGAFDFLFNICYPRDHPINSLVPPDFQPLQPTINWDYNILEYREFSWGAYLASDDIRANPTHPSGTQFTTSSPQGAILTMPRGAYVQRLANADHFHEYIAANATSWYRFVNGQLMRGARNGDIRIVFGCHKSTAWGMATVLNTSQYAQSQTLRFAAFQPYHNYPHHISYFWEASGSALFKVGPEPGDNEGLLENHPHELRNQCLFVRANAVTLGETSWSSLNPKDVIAYIVGEREDSQNHESVPRRAPTGLPTIARNMGIRERPNSVAIHSDIPSLDIIDHTKAINTILLRQNPEMQVAITEDKEWCTVMKNEDPTQIASSHLFSSICERNHIRKTSTGLVYFELKDQNPEKSPITFTVREVNDLLKSLKQDKAAIKDKLLSNLPDLKQLGKVIHLSYFSKPSNNGTIPDELPPYLMKSPEDLFVLDYLLKSFQSEDHDIEPIHGNEYFTKSQAYKELNSSSFAQAHRRRYLKALGDGAWKRYLQFGNLDDLDETIWSYEKTLSLTPAFAIQSLVPLFGLCSALFRRFVLKRNLHDLVHLARFVRRQDSFDLNALISRLSLVPMTSMAFLTMRPIEPEHSSPTFNVTTRFVSTPIDLLTQLKEYVPKVQNHTIKENRHPEKSLNLLQMENQFIDLLDLTQYWIYHADSHSPILWLYGPSATAMVSNLIERLPPSRSEGYVGSIFTFSDKAAWNNEADQLFPSIAVELAHSVPGLFKEYSEIVARKGSEEIMTSSLEIQFWSLIIDPISKLPSKHTRTVVINAIDNSGYEITRTILTLITNALTIFALPLRFIIASNRDTRIQDLFNRPSLSSISRQFFVGIQPTTTNGAKDPTEIIRRGLQVIREQHPSLMLPGGKKWPSDDVFDLLVKRSRKNPGYADTVIRFIASIGNDPKADLQRVLKTTPTPLNLSQEMTVAFADLDNLFTHILSTHRDRNALVHALGILLVLHDCAQPQTILQDIFGMRTESYNSVLQVLRSLMHFPKVENEHDIHPWRAVKKNVPKKDQRVKSPSLVLALLSLSTMAMPTAFTIPLAFRDRVHDSFYDFLVNPERSGPFYVDISKHHGHLTMAGFACVLNYMWRPARLVFRLNRFPTISQETWDYLTFHLPDHYSQCHDRFREGIIEQLQDALNAVSRAVRDNTESDVLLSRDEFLDHVAILINMIINDWESFGQWSHFTSKHTGKYADFRRVMALIREELFPQRSSLRLRRLSNKFTRAPAEPHHYAHHHHHQQPQYLRQV